MPTPVLHAVLWDLDGTLLDIEPLSTDAINAVVSRFGKRETPAIKREITGMRPSDWTRVVISRLELEGKLTQDELHRESDAVLRSLLPTCALMPGAESVTAALHGRGVPMAIATSSDASAVLMKRQRHGPIFDRMGAIVTGETVARGKPNPDIFLAAAARLGVDPAACVVVEDSLLGVKAGVAAGMRVVAVPDALQDPADFRAAGAALVLASLTEWRWEEEAWAEGIAVGAGAGAGAGAVGTGGAAAGCGAASVAPSTSSGVAEDGATSAGECMAVEGSGAMPVAVPSE
jgi:HAD superfamily hydrolase (TIGR01509 family)